MAIIEYDKWPEGTVCCECGCDDSTIDFVPDEYGDWICFECLSWRDTEESEDMGWDDE